MRNPDVTGEPILGLRRTWNWVVKKPRLNNNNGGNKAVVGGKPRTPGGSRRVRRGDKNDGMTIASVSSYQLIV